MTVRQLLDHEVGLAAIDLTLDIEPSPTTTGWGRSSARRNRTGILGLPGVPRLEVELPFVNGTGTAQALGIESVFRCGFMKPFTIRPFGSSPRAYGHTGAGGSFACADPETGHRLCLRHESGGLLPADRSARDRVA